MSRTSDPTGAVRGAIPVAASAAVRALAGLMEQAYGASASAESAMSVALELATLDAPPAEATELLEFARDHLAIVLEADLGATLALALLDNLVVDLAQLPGETSPVSMRRPTDRSEPLPTSRAMPLPISRATPSAIARAVVRPMRTGAVASIAILLVDDDRVGRTPVARALVRGGCAIEVAESASEVAAMLRADQRFDVAIVDAQHPELTHVLEAIAGARPALAVLARSGDPQKARTLLQAAGIARFDAHARDAHPDSLVQLVRFLATASGS